MSAELEPYITPWTVIVDSREQAPFQFLNFKADASKKNRPMIVCQEVRGLKTGDYSLVGYEDRIAVERKSLEDAYSTFSHGRDRFERELERFAELEYGLVVIETGWPRILSRSCPDCSGVGFHLRDELDIFTLAFNRNKVGKYAQHRFADVLRDFVIGEAMGDVGDWYKCERCQGSGRIHPLDHSKFSPKSFFRSVIAWKQRYPNVHWWACDTRQFAEQVTLRELERFWLDDQERIKQGK